MPISPPPLIVCGVHPELANSLNCVQFSHFTPTSTKPHAKIALVIGKNILVYQALQRCRISRTREHKREKEN